MVQTLVLFEYLPSPEWLASRQGEPFRATAEFTSGPYEGMGIISSGGSHHGQLREIRLHLPRFSPGGVSSMTLLDPLPLPIPHPIVAHIPPDEEIVLALVKTVPGAARRYLNELPEAGDGVGVAVGHLLGRASSNVLLELVGSDAEAVFGAALELTDADVVESVEFLRTTGELTSGFGDPSS